jgi:hypothetical protein
MTGLLFGSLKVIQRDGWIRKEAAWRCQCECGEIALVRGNCLRSGKATHCGCQRAVRISRTLTRHGRTGESVYTTWTAMLGRCGNENNQNYFRYGGRGIRVCERWLAFENFLADMGERPPGLTLERIDNDGNYEPGNVRWATPKEQANNTRRNHVIQTSRGPLSLTQVAEIAGITKVALHYRMRKGLTGDQLLAPGVNGRRLSTIL